jgi:hypothetical protein
VNKIPSGVTIVFAILIGLLCCAYMIGYGNGRYSVVEEEHERLCVEEMLKTGKVSDLCWEDVKRYLLK